MAGSPGSKYYDIFLDYDIKLCHKNKGKILDEYAFELLKQIDETGSLKQAAQNINVSYRKAWDSVESIETLMGFKLVNRQRGGSHGGKTELTPEGIQLIGAHNSLRQEFNEAIKKITKNFFQSINKPEE